MTTILAAIGIGVVVLLGGGLPLSALNAWNHRVGIAVPWVGYADGAVPMGLLAVHRRPVGRRRWGRGAATESARQPVVAARVGSLTRSGSNRVRFPGRVPRLRGSASDPSCRFAHRHSVRHAGSDRAVADRDGIDRRGCDEEAAFRGYMQGPVERRYGLAVAVLVNGTLFGLLHFPTHPAYVLWMLPYYIAVSAVYGGLTWAANSILPRWCCTQSATSWCSLDGGLPAARSGKWVRHRLHRFGKAA